VPERNGWNCKTEIDATRVAAYFGHDKVSEVFLQSDLVFSSSKTDRLFAASLGAAEAGRVSDLTACLAELRNKGVSLKPILSDLSVEYDGLLRSDQFDNCTSVLSGSLVGCVLSYCLSSTEALSERTPHFTILHWVLDNVNMDVAAFVRAASLILGRLGSDCDRSCDPFIDMFTYMVDQLDLNVWSCRSILHDVAMIILKA
jgi:hypothetical protein